tara:strand:- start:23 stop:163 length:141 start_codon:yes stop_codon:yes gene_type:complete
MKELIKSYIDQLTPQEKKVMEIAQKNLGSSFNIEKSIGFISWLAKQ